MIANEIIKWLLLFWYLWLLLRLFRSMAQEGEKERQKAFGGNGEGSPGGQDSQNNQSNQQQDSSQSQEQEGEGDDEETGRNANRVKKLLENDRKLASDLSRQAGLEEHTAEEIINDPKLLRKIAQKIPEHILEMFAVASRKAILDLDLESGSELVPVRSGGVYQEPGRIRDLNDLPRLRAREWLRPRPLRNLRILTKEAQTMKRFDLKENLVVLEILEDVSGSMGDHMSDGDQKWIWARGVTMKLALQAARGKSIFLYRQFDSKPKRLFVVESQKDAKAFIDTAVRLNPSGGGTDILGALYQAINDIKGSDKKFTDAHIMLISDGEDGNVNTKVLRQILGDIKLHVVAIGNENGALAKVATTYQSFK